MVTRDDPWPTRTEPFRPLFLVWVRRSSLCFRRASVPEVMVLNPLFLMRGLLLVDMIGKM